MEDLSDYWYKFDEVFERYTDYRYDEIGGLFAIYDCPSAQRVVNRADFLDFLKLVLPIVAVKDYKSQSSFPEYHLAMVIQSTCKLKSLGNSLKPDDRKVGDIFQKIVSELTTVRDSKGKRIRKKTGFDLPTVSAVFHFCYPNKFPIVDRYVAAACEYLHGKRDRESELPDAYPTLPTSESTAKYKWDRYTDFIKFLDAVRRTQNDMDSRYVWSYRDIDRALMVIGFREIG